MSVALVIQHAKRTRGIILSSVACLAQHYFTTFSRTVRFSGGGMLLTTKSVFRVSLQLQSESFLILRRIRRDIITNIHGEILLQIYTCIHTKNPLLRVYKYILMKFEFSRYNFEKYSNIKFHENPSSGSRAVQGRRTDGRRDRHCEAKRRFSQFFEAIIR